MAGVALGAVMSEIAFYFLDTGETRPPQTIVLTISAGTAARVAQGLADPNLPSSINFVLGDKLLVVNNDVVVHELGPLLVPPQSSATMQLNSPSTSAVSCSFLPSKYLGLAIGSPLDSSTRLVGILEAGVPMGLLFALYALFATPAKVKAI
jgi:hypothetical protein